MRCVLVALEIPWLLVVHPHSISFAGKGGVLLWIL
jgi:hypothetical protein